MKNSLRMLPQTLILLAASLLFFTNTFSQDFNPVADLYQRRADSLYDAGQYQISAQNYCAEAEARRMLGYKKQAAVNASYSYALAEMPDSALACLVKAVKEYGFNNKEWMNSDPNMAVVRKSKGYSDLMRFIEERRKALSDPDQAAVITSDIALFWKVYDQFQKDTSNAHRLFLTEYFEKGTADLQEYYRVKTPNIGGLSGFVRNLKKMPEYYASIRLNTERVGQLEDTIRVIFRNLKNWYEPATFPNVAFVIGGWSSGGIVTDYGSIMGVDMQAAHELTPTHELNLWQQRNMLSFDNLKHVDRPSDLGYWVGYQICKAFFDQATDKKKAVYDMLNIRNYQAFLTESKVDEILSQRRKE